MPIPLNKLAGAELLPRHKKTADPYLKERFMAYNMAVDRLNVCAIAIDEEALREIISSELFNDSFYQILLSKADKFLKIVRVDDASTIK